MRLLNSSMIEKRQRDWVAHQNQCYRINQSEINIWFINSRINCYISTSTLYYDDLYIIDRLFSWIDSSTTQRVKTSIYLLDNFFNDCTSILFITTRKRIWNRRVCRSNQRVLFNFVRNSFSTRSSTSHLSIYLLDIAFSFNNRSNVFLHHDLRYLTKTYAIARQIDAFFSFSFRRFRFRFRFVVMKVFIFSTFTDDTTSISFSLKSLFTYEKRLASLLVIRFYFNATRRFHFKTIMIVVDFSKKSNSIDSNDIECLICFLKLYTRYYISKSLKKHFRNASHCSFAQQFQQKIESKKIVESKNIVEKSKIESFFAFVFLVKLLSIYENRLTSLNKWRNVDSKNVLVVVEFSDIDICYKAQCAHCSIEIFGVDREKKSLKYHFRQSFECSLVLQLETTKLEISKTIIDVSKFIFVVANIDFFDFIFLCDIQKFDLHHETTNFCQHLQNIRINYREEELLSLLLECFRDFALAWYKQQNDKKQSENEIVKKNLSEWLEILIIAFSSKFFAKSSIQISASNLSISSTFSSQYHSCLNCFAFFSSLTRLLQHIQKVICFKVVCKRCEEVFDSKNKFHEHIRQHHATKKMNKLVSRRNFNREKDKISTISSTISQTTSSIISSTTTSKFSKFRSVTSSEWSRIASFAFSSISLVIFATSKNIFWTRIVFTSVISSKRSRFSIFSSKIVSKRVKIASITCSSISLATFSSWFRESISKFYFTIDDLIRMFREKFKSFDLSQHQNRRVSSQSFDVCSSIIHQSRIIVYFLFAINQKTSISQNLKNSKSKSFQQHTFAKSIRFASALSKKSTLSSYKNLNIFYISLQSRFSFLQSRFSFAWSRFTFSSFIRFSSLFEFSFSNLRVCYICFDRFNFRNDSFDYRRFIQRYSSNRRSIEERNSRFETKFAKRKK